MYNMSVLCVACNIMLSSWFGFVLVVVVNPLDLDYSSIYSHAVFSFAPGRRLSLEGPKSCHEKICMLPMLKQKLLRQVL